MKRVVICLVGRPGSGKSTVAGFLVESKGFARFGLGDVVREELQTRGNSDPSRKDLQDTGDELRAQFGVAVLSERAWKKIEDSASAKAVVEGSRHPGDIEYLKQKADKFLCLALIADQKVRYERITARGLPQDPVGWEAFLEFDQRDASDETNPNGQSTEACVALADYKVDTNLDKEHVFKKAREILKKERII